MTTDSEDDRWTVAQAAAHLGVEVELLIEGLRRFTHLGPRERYLGERILPDTRVTFAEADHAAYKERHARTAAVLGVLRRWS
jgi:hypothetical protein